MQRFVTPLYAVVVFLATTSLVSAQGDCYATYSDDEFPPTLHVPCVDIEMQSDRNIFGFEFLYQVTLHQDKSIKDTEGNDYLQFHAQTIDFNSELPDSEAAKACYAQYDHDVKRFYIPCLTFQGQQYKVELLEIENQYLDNSTDFTEIHRAFDTEGSIVFSRDIRFALVYNKLLSEAETTTRAGSAQKPAYPVLFIHGLNSSSDTWERYKTYWPKPPKNMTYGGLIKVEDALHMSMPGNEANSNVRRSRPVTLIYDINTSGLRRGDFYTMNLSNNHDISYASQGLQVREAVHKIIELTATNGVFIVGHSMGGLAPRAYMQYFAQGDNYVKGLITIGAPHLGRRDGVLGDLGASFISGNVVPELAPNSADLNILNNLSKYPLPTGVKTTAVAVRGKSFFSSSWSDSTGDGIVSIPSQRFQGSGWEVINLKLSANGLRGIVEVHTQETKASIVEDAIWHKLLQWSN